MLGLNGGEAAQRLLPLCRHAVQPFPQRRHLIGPLLRHRKITQRRIALLRHDIKAR